MTKISPSYRNDSAEIDMQLREYLDSVYFEKLQNIRVPNPKIFVVFSGGSAVGKSTLARKIESDLKALVIENDGIKRCLLKKNPLISRGNLDVLTWKYHMSLYARIDELSPNGLVVRDGVIDWYYDRILPIFEKKNFETFSVFFNASKAKRVELIEYRGDTPTVTAKALVEIMSEQDVHIDRYRKEHASDIVLSDSNLFDHEKVIKLLRERVAQLKSQE